MIDRAGRLSYVAHTRVCSSKPSSAPRVPRGGACRWVVSLTAVLTAVLVLTLQLPHQGTAQADVIDKSPNFKMAAIAYGLRYRTTDAIKVREMTWLAEHFDMLLGIADKRGPEDMPILTEDYFDIAKTANPNIKLLTYIPYNTMFDRYTSVQVQWATTHGFVEEDLYYHWYNDGWYYLRTAAPKCTSSGDYKSWDIAGTWWICPWGVDPTVSGTGSCDETRNDGNKWYVWKRGYGGPSGTATSLAQARVMASWWCRQFPNVAPGLPGFEGAYSHLLQQMGTVEGNPSKHLNGSLLDTFEGSTEGIPLVIDYSVYPENVREIRQAVGGDVATDITRAQGREWVEQKQAAHMARLVEDYKNFSGLSQDEAWIVPNMASLDAWNTYPQGIPGMGASYNKGLDEYFAYTTQTATWVLPKLKVMYEHMVDNDVSMVMNFMTYFKDGATELTLDWLQWGIALGHIMNNDKFWFAFYKGAPDRYGPGDDETYANDFWTPNFEFDVGAPMTRSETDWWGNTGTDRPFIFASGEVPQADDKLGPYQILGREFENALVLNSFWFNSGYTKLGLFPVTVPLGGTYRRLLEDNTFGPEITEFTFTNGAGVILVKEHAYCPQSCAVGDACAPLALVGDPSDCSARCIAQPITTCDSGDGCCPALCSNSTDSDCPETCIDQDNDSHEASSCGGTDCDDDDPARHPDATEVCDDNTDNDCDGLTDEADIDDCQASNSDSSPDAGGNDNSAPLSGGGCDCRVAGAHNELWTLFGLLGIALLLRRKRKRQPERH